MADMLDVPMDTITDVPHTQIFGKSQVSIENFRGILDYDTTSFKINTRSGIIHIEGSELTISYITNEEVSLKGTITKLEFI